MEYNSCSTQEEQIMYAFDIKIIDNDDNIIKKKCLSIDKIGHLLECENNIKKIKIVCCIININMNSIVLKKSFEEQINDTVILFKKNVVIYISKNIDNLSINFQIL